MDRDFHFLFSFCSPFDIFTLLRRFDRVALEGIFGVVDFALFHHQHHLEYLNPIKLKSAPEHSI
jgi:hypothetical protein